MSLKENQKRRKNFPEILTNNTYKLKQKIFIIYKKIASYINTNFGSNIYFYIIFRFFKLKKELQQKFI